MCTLRLRVLLLATVSLLAVSAAGALADTTVQDDDHYIILVNNNGDNIGTVQFQEREKGSGGAGPIVTFLDADSVDFNLGSTNFNVTSTATNIGGTLGVTGATTLSTLSTSGLASLDSLGVGNNASVGGTLGVTGNTSLSTLSTSGLASLNGGAAVVGAGGANAFTVSRGTSAAAMDVAGNATFVGDGGTHAVSISAGTATNAVGVAGNIVQTSGSTSLLATTVGGTLDVSGATTINGTTTINADAAVNGRFRVDYVSGAISARLRADETGAAVLYNGHGLEVSNGRTVLSGGTSSTFLTLDDDGAHFSSTGGGPARVTGVADGRQRYDAVNYGQLQGVAQKAATGIAQVSAMANIPAPGPGKRLSLGVGYGHFDGRNALAMGAVASLNDHVAVRGSIGVGDGSPSVYGGGVGMSW